MQQFILFLKGLIIGIGKIIPGVSGSMLATFLGVYENSIQKLATFFKNPYQSFKYLIFLFLGIMVAIIVFSKMILFFMTNYKSYTMMFFLGLLISTIPIFIKKNLTLNKKDIFFIIIVNIILFLLTFNINLPSFTINSNKSYLWIFFLGGIEALSMIIPGLSGTAIFLMLGSYTFILNFFANPFANLLITFLFCLGFILIFIIMTKIMAKTFYKYPKQTWLVIFCFIIYSLLEFILAIPFSYSLKDFFLFLILFILGYLIGYLLPS